jgi:hypothetical protein
LDVVIVEVIFGYIVKCADVDVVEGVGMDVYWCMMLYERVVYIGEEPYSWNAGTPGSIDLRSGGTNDVDDSGDGGNITMRGGSGNGCNAGSLDTSAGYGTSGGDINTSGLVNPGGSINTSNGGGSIDLRGQGVISLGSPWEGTSTMLVGTAFNNIVASFPDYGGRIMVAPEGAPAGMSPYGDLTAASFEVNRPENYAQASLISGPGFSSFLRWCNNNVDHASSWILACGSDTQNVGNFVLLNEVSQNVLFNITPDEALYVAASNVQITDAGAYFSSVYADGVLTANNGLEINAGGIWLAGGFLESDGASLYWNGTLIAS